MSVFQTKNGRWRVQVRRKSGNVDELYDNRVDAEARQQMLDGGPGGGVTFGTFLDTRYLRDTVYTELSLNSRNTYAVSLIRLREFYGHRLLSSIDSISATEYKNKRSRDSVKGKPGAHPSRATIAAELSALSAVLSYAVELDYLSHHPIRDTLRKLKGKPVRRTRRVSLDEIDRLIQGMQGGASLGLKYFNGRRRVLTIRQIEACRFFYILSMLGCRAGELAALECSSVSTQQLKYRTKLKGGTPVWRSLDPECAHVVLLQLAHAQTFKYKYLFETAGGPYRFKNAADAMRDTGVLPADWHPHALRREFISSALESGAPPNVIQAATGHSRASSLEMYDESALDAPARVALVQEMFRRRSAKAALDKSYMFDPLYSPDLIPDVWLPAEDHGHGPNNLEPNADIAALLKPKRG